MEHEVLDCPVPGNTVDLNKVKMPTIEELNSCQCILITFAEYMQPWLEASYGANWKRVKVPKVARYDESFDRVDLASRMDWNKLQRWADFHFFPAIQDAERFDGYFLPFGADLSMFNTNKPEEKKYDLGFIGQLYSKRATYAENLARYLGDTIFYGGPIIISDLSGVPALGYEEEQTRLLAKNYKQIKIFFCLPPLSNLLVAKVFEVMGCGTFIMFPCLTGVASRNLKIFEDYKHLVYYNEGSYQANVENIKFWIEHDKEREKIAAEGAALVREKYSLEKMLEHMLAPVTKHAQLPNMGKRSEVVNEI